MNEIFEFGDIFVTRNANEEDNGMPGYWNHIAIFTKLGIVEAQMPPIGNVICSNLDEFINRYPTINVYRWNKDIGEKAAQAALSFIGVSYRMIASIFKHLRRNKGENCISMVRKCYQTASNIDPRWRIPDNVVNDTRLTLIWNK